MGCELRVLLVGGERPSGVSAALGLAQQMCTERIRLEQGQKTPSSKMASNKKDLKEGRLSRRQQRPRLRGSL